MSLHVSAKSDHPEGNGLYIVEDTEGKCWPKHVEIILILFYCNLCYIVCSVGFGVINYYKTLAVYDAESGVSSRINNFTLACLEYGNK